MKTYIKISNYSFTTCFVLLFLFGAGFMWYIDYMPSWIPKSFFIFLFLNFLNFMPYLIVDLSEEAKK